MTTLYVSHPAALDHAVPEGHPERPDRIRAIERVLENERLRPRAHHGAPGPRPRSPTLAHPAEYVEAIVAAAPKEGMVAIDSDTLMSPGSLEATLRAVGGGILAVDAVMGRECSNAFVAMRPPGHHAERTRAMGFCLFNHAAIAARHARAKGASRVALVDWDVHHGNGSQDIFWGRRRRDVRLDPPDAAVSRNGRRLRARRQGHHRQRAPAPGRRRGDLPRGLRGWHPRRVDAFAPDVIILSAGFDAHHLDPLANLRLDRSRFRLGHAQADGGRRPPFRGRLVSMLEGGYSLDGLGRSVSAHVDALMGR